MIEIVNYFNDNKKNIIDYIAHEKYIFPKIFLQDVQSIHDTDLYKTITNHPVFGYLFSIEKIKIFNIQRITSESYCFKSDIDYKSICLFISDKSTIYLNDNIMKNKNVVTYNSKDEIFIKGDFLKISFLEKSVFDFNDISIPYREKNLFSDLKRNKYSISIPDFFKSF